MYNGLVSYKFGRKNNWRRWVWNQVKKRVIDPSKEVVLYLPTEDDLDREIAISKGFKEHNLIGINKNEVVCKKLRKQKKIAIHGDLAGVLLSWPFNTAVQPSVIVADLCGNLNSAVTILDAVLLHKKHARKVLVLNMYRGRETKEPNKILKLFRERILCTPNVCVHRADIINLLLHALLGLRIFNKVPLSLTLHDLVNNIIEEYFAPSTFTYQSINGSQMDTIVVTLPDWFQTTEMMFKTSEEFLLRIFDQQGKGIYTREILANLAVRTMRLNGYFDKDRNNKKMGKKLKENL